MGPRSASGPTSRKTRALNVASGRSVSVFAFSTRVALIHVAATLFYVVDEATGLGQVIQTWETFSCGKWLRPERSCRRAVSLTIYNSCCR